VTTRLEKGILTMQVILFDGNTEPPATASAFGSEETPEEVAAQLFKKLQP
jgi:hypothetical protein